VAKLRYKWVKGYDVDDYAKYTANVGKKTTIEVDREEFSSRWDAKISFAGVGSIYSSRDYKSPAAAKLGAERALARIMADK
jgi:hypothetical protein